MSLVVVTWRNPSSSKLGTSLTMAGIAVGVALILVLLSLVAGIDGRSDTPTNKSTLPLYALSRDSCS
jgi:ABC-type lipoprotein release transport system permease subunit